MQVFKDVHTEFVVSDAETVYYVNTIENATVYRWNVTSHSPRRLLWPLLCNEL